ncbi:MAG: tetratricopeptide repeat protein [Bacteroidales bacterium]|nr:tetratricopeptide repeat protein [Bacteroidales bacterium]
MQVLKNNKIKLYSLFVIALIAFTACSTEKNTSLSRFYHNTTTYYNIYFNANEAYKKGMKQAEASNTDNYVAILPMFVISKPEASSSVSGDMDKAIKKSSKAIKYHSITAKPKMKTGRMSAKERDFYAKNEYNKWMDDCYLLMGKAHFAKHDFLQARVNFEYILRQFPKEKLTHDAKIMLARTHAETGNYKAAKDMLDLIEADKTMPKKYGSQFAEAYADFYIKQDQFEDAIPKLRRAAKEVKGKKNKLRYKYILAQLLEEVGQEKAASDMYSEVTKRNPNYEMEFNARINMARLYSGSGGKEVRKKLRRMTRDDKNIEYLDQVYYAIAEIDHKDGKTKDAIKNYKLSSEKSMSNSYQKAITCEKLGIIYYAEKDYINAQAYYDTCLANLPYDYRTYKDIQEISRNLTDLVDELNVVSLEDSLQKLANMNEADRNKLIDKIIADLIEEERREQELMAEQQMSSMLFDQRRDGGHMNPAAPSGGKWYFYNPAQLSFGRNEFTKKWGNRKNEDHWRRKNKAVVDFIADSEDADSLDANAETSRRLTDPKNRDYYMQDLPLNDSLMKLSNERIVEALFNSGRIYKEQFEDLEQAAYSFSTLNTRFPDNIYLLLSYYNLYLISKDLNRTSDMETYKNLVITKFPDSHYANLLRNPNYIAELEAQRNASIQLYNKTYDAYILGQCNQVNQNVNQYLEGRLEADLTPKFKFLSVLCEGKTGSENSFMKRLLQFVNEFPNTEEEQAAEDILAYFGSSDIEELRRELASRPDVEIIDIGQTGTDIDSITPPAEIFTLEDTDAHYYIILVNADKIDLNRLSFEVRNFNIFTFSIKNFMVMNSVYDSNYQMVIVRSFDNKRQSLNYMRMISTNPDVFGRIESTDYKQFTISEENYQTLKKLKNVNKYLEFFEENYQNN